MLMRNKVDEEQYLRESSAPQRKQMLWAGMSSRARVGITTSSVGTLFGYPYSTGREKVANLM